jgi:hypothetical protein
MIMTVLRRRSVLLALLVGVLLLATATRVFQLDDRSLWADEGWTLVLSQGPTVADITQRMAFDQHPPLYFILIHQWRDLTGDTEFALRMLSVLTGVVAVAGMYQLGRQMFNTETGLVAALLLALWDHHIDLSQDVRHYAQLATFIILSSWFYFRLIQQRPPTRGTRLGYVLTSSALLYSHYLGGFVLICQFVHMLIFVHPFSRLRWTVFHFGATCATFLPWLPVVIRQNQVRWETPLYYLNSLPSTSETYGMVRDAVLGQQYALIGLLVLLGVIYISYRKTGIIFRWRPVSPVAFALLWGLGYVAMTYALNRPGREFLTIRNFIVMTPAVVVLAAHGVTNLEPRLRGFMLVVLVALMLNTVDTRQLKPPWRDVFQNVATYHQDNEPVLMDIWVGDFPGRYYVEQQTGDDTPWLSLREARDQYATQFLPVVKGYVQDYDAFWLVFWQSSPVDEMPYADGFAEAGFQRTVTLYEDHVGNRLYSYRYDRVTGENIAQFWRESAPLVALQSASVPAEAAPGETIPIRLLFAALDRPPLDYSVSVFLLDEAGNLATPPQDGPPQNGNAPTSQWQPGELIFDQRNLVLPASIPAGTYTIGTRLYYYQQPDQPLPTCPSGQGCSFARVGEITITGE